MNTQGTIWLDGSSFGNLKKIRYIDLAFIRCGFRKAEATPTSVETIYSN
jgi:hypothetical protein